MHLQPHLHRLLSNGLADERALAPSTCLEQTHVRSSKPSFCASDLHRYGGDLREVAYCIVASHEVEVKDVGTRQVLH